MSNPMALVIGVGPGVGSSVATVFGRAGYDVALVGNDEPVLRELGDTLGDRGIRVLWSVVDITDAAAFRAAIEGFGEAAGRIDVLHFNPSAYRPENVLQLTPEGLAEDVTLGVGALLTALQTARPYLSRGGRVTATGSMAADRPSEQAPSLGVQKAGLRNLIDSIDQTLRPDGIRAVSVTVRGSLSAEGPFSPDRVAEAVHAAATQDESQWRTELPYPEQPVP